MNLMKLTKNEWYLYYCPETTNSVYWDNQENEWKTLSFGETHLSAAKKYGVKRLSSWPKQPKKNCIVLKIAIIEGCEVSNVMRRMSTEEYENQFREGI